MRKMEGRTRHWESLEMLAAGVAIALEISDRIMRIKIPVQKITD